MQQQDSNLTRRQLLASEAILGGLALSGHLSAAQTSAGTQNWPGRAFGNSLLSGKVAIITGAARGGTDP